MKAQIIEFLKKEFNLHFESSNSISKKTNAQILIFDSHDFDLCEKEIIEGKLFNLIFEIMNIQFCNFEIFVSESEEIFLIIECDEIN